jgi:hypothetical protein
MPRWLTGFLIALLVCVVAGVVGGRMLVRRVQSELSEPVEIAIAESVESSVLQAIQTQGPEPAELRISQLDLDINTATGPAGESGFEVTTFGDQDLVVIYGATTTIDDSGISILLADMEFHAVPVVEEDHFELTGLSTEKGISGWIISPDAFEAGLESGINDALAASGLTPESITLDHGQMTITTEAHS